MREDVTEPEGTVRSGRARIVSTARGREVRCPEHGHLLGILDEANRLIIKCGRNEYVMVEVDEAH